MAIVTSGKSSLKQFGLQKLPKDRSSFIQDVLEKIDKRLMLLLEINISSVEQCRQHFCSRGTRLPASQTI